jgi:hypothetical protein
MITALVKIYQSECHGLKQCLDSLQNIDQIIVCDGRYPDSAWGTSDPKQLEYFQKRYPPGNESTDGSKTIASGYSNLTWLGPPSEGWTSETAKDNHMLGFVPDDTWVLFIDPDERLVGNIRGAVPAVPCDVVPILVRDRQGHSLYYFRLFKKKPGLSFATHHSLLFATGTTVELYLGNAPESTYILHERIEIG